MIGFVTVFCQVFAAYVIFKWSLKKMAQWDHSAREDRLKQEIVRARQITDAVLQKIEDTRKNIDDRLVTSELDSLLLMDAMNRSARAIAALVAVLKEQGVSQDQIDEIIATIDNQQHAL